MARVLGDRRALAEAVFGRGQHGLLLVLRHQHAHDVLAAVGSQPHAAHPGGPTAHRAHVGLLETDRLPAVREQHHVVVAVGQRGTDQEVVSIEAHGDDPGGSRAGKFRQRRLLDRALRGRHEHVVLLVELLDRQHRGDLLALLKREDVHDRLAAAGARALRHLVDLEPVEAPAVGEAQQVVVRMSYEQAVDEIVFLGRGRLLAAPPAPLRAVVCERLRLDVPAVRERDHHVLRRDQVLERNVLGVDFDHAAARVAELLADLLQLATDDGGDALGAGEHVEQVGDGLHHLPVLGDDLVLLEAGQALQAQFEDRLGLIVGQNVAFGLEAVLGCQPLGTERIGRRAVQHVAHHLRRPGLRHQAALGLGGRRRLLDQLDDIVDVGQRNSKAFEDMAALARLFQLEHRAAGDHLAAVRDEALDQVLEVEHLGLVVDQRHHVHAEGVLQLRMLVEVVEDDLGQFVPLQFDHDAHAVLVGLVANVGNALDLLLAHQLGDPLEQGLLVHLVGQLVDDDRLAVALADVLEVGLGAHHHAAAAGAVALAHAGHAVDDARGREVRRRDDLDQLVDGDLGFCQQRKAPVDHLGEVVRRDVGGHADRDARGAVDEQVRDARGHHQRLVLRAVVVRPEVDGLLVDVDQQLVADPRHADLGVTHGRRVVAVDRAEVALPVDQHVAQREILRHAHDGVVHGGVAVGVVLADDVTDDTRRLLVGPVPVVGQLVHRVEHAAVDGFQPVAHVRQRAPDDHAHRVIEVRPSHLLFDADREGFFCELVHACPVAM